MGVEARVVVYSASAEAAIEGADAAFLRIEEVEQALSSWRPDSKLHQLMRAAGETIPASGDLREALVEALEVSRASGGAFDPTAGALFEVWARAREAGVQPQVGEVMEARARADHEAVHFPSEGVFVEPGIELDLSGIGKGYACDAALRALEQRGLARAMVELGGDMALGAAPPGQEGWRIAAGSGLPGVEDEVLVLTRTGLATSGDRWHGMDTESGRLSHLIDPRTGRPAQHGRTVTVVAEAASTADALATAASVMELGAAQALVAGFGARLIVQEPAPVEEVEPLAALSDWVTLFDGASLEGWTTTGGRYDGNARWSVEDGAIVGRPGPGGEGGLLYTKAPYAAFEIEFETKLDYPFDSGVFARMLPPESGLKGMQITLDHREGGEIAGLYADGWVQNNPEGEALFAKNEWNLVRVRCTGFDLRTECWINGELAIDHRLPANAEGYAPQGLIGIQVHPVDSSQADQRAQFRKVRVRELPMFGEDFAGRSADLLEDGLEGWVARGSQDGYSIEDGVLSIPAEGGGEIVTAADFGDFRLSAEFKISEMANSGVFLRSARDGENPSYAGWEIQILDDFNWEEVTDSELVDYQLTGGLYGAVPPDAAAKRYFEPGVWNRYEILARGSRLAAALNGRVLWDVDAAELEVSPAYDERPMSGFIGFQRYGAPDTAGETAVELRNLRIESLDSDD